VRCRDRIPAVARQRRGGEAAGGLDLAVETRPRAERQVAAEAGAARAGRAAKAAATKVDFFTMVRGEDQ
jgi:alpha-D-ribose 1-methylphosphonate 5-triphosphate synthase subunit PhnG